MSKVPEEYRNTIEQINADGEKDANQQMQTVYENQKEHLDELHKFIGMLYIKYAINGLLNLSSVAKASVMAEINSKLKDIGKDLGQTEINEVTEVLKNSYSDVYYKNAFVMEKSFNVNLKFNILKDEHINASINTKLDGELFSDRIWKNKADMLDKLHKSLVDITNGKATIDKAGKMIQETFNVGAYESKRLMITELTRVQSQAQNDIAVNTGIKQHMWSATLDTRTCQECAELDGKIFDIGGNSPQMPLHPLDRCCWINVPFPDWKPTKRKDNMTKGIINYKDYNNWLRDIGNVEGKNRGSKIDITDIAISKVPIVKIIGFDDIQNKILQQKHQKLLKIAQTDNNSNEVLNIITTDLYNEAITLGSKNGVDPGNNPQAVTLMRTAKENSMGWVHNHPGGSTFSYTDIGQFLKPQIKFITAVTNQGKVFVLDKKDNFNFVGIYAKIKEIKNKYGGTVTSENHDLIVNDILKMITKYGVKYTK